MGTENLRFDGLAWEGISKECKKFIGWTLMAEPTDRWTAEEALASPWLTERCPETSLVQLLAAEDDTEDAPALQGSCGLDSAG